MFFLCLSYTIYFGPTRTGFISLSYSRLLALTDARSCLERPVSLSSWSINVVAWRPLERLPCFGSELKKLLGNSLIFASPTVATKLQQTYLETSYSSMSSHLISEPPNYFCLRP